MGTFLFLLSVALGMILFVKLLGPDAWLIKGLREDRIGAVCVMGLVAVCAILIFILLRFFLPLVTNSFAIIFVGPDDDSSPVNTQAAFAYDIVPWFLTLFLPILSAYLLHLAYRGVGWVIKKCVLQYCRIKP